MGPRAGFLRSSVLFVGETLLVALALFAMDAFAHLRFDVGQYFLAWGVWSVDLLAVSIWRARVKRYLLAATLVEAVGPGIFLNELGAWGHGGFSASQILYVLLLVAVLLRGWRAWIGLLKSRGEEVAGHVLRVLVVGGAVVGITFPLFTDRLVGGTDARWYAYMMGDFIAQLRSGVFPIFVGQGDLAWNGGVHPFRSAPVFQHVGGFWDLVTLRVLTPIALQHLAAITAAFVGGLGMYSAGVALMPKRRWEAAAVGLIYLCTPAALRAIYQAEAYMTWMAFAALPLAFYGNARALLAPDDRSYAPLAAGLALVWMCHPPIALLTTLATVLLQGGRLLCGDVTPARGWAAVTGALLFLGLAAFYFVSMGDLPSREPVTLRKDLLQLTGIALWLTGLVGAALRGRGNRWLVLLAPGAWLMWMGRSPWLWWMVVTALLVAAVAGAARWRRWFDPARFALEILLPCALIAAGIVQAWIGPTHPERDVIRLADLNFNASESARFFQPISPLGNLPGDWQPGLGLWVALVLLGVGFFRARALAAKLWFAVGLLPVLMIVRVPYVSEFLAGFSPRWFASVAGLTFTLRLMPALAGLLAVGWLVWMATQPEGGRKSCVWPGLVLALAVGWSGYEAARFVQVGFRGVATRAHTEKQLRSENVVLESFAYDLIPEPTYFSNGQTDYRLEVRALDSFKRVRIGPDITALRMEETGRAELKLVCLPYQPPAPDWLMLGPSLTLAPSEHVLLRFEFDATKNYSGFLFLISASARSYREYALPESGLRRAFGTTAKASRVISLWNSGTVAEKYDFSFRRGPSCTLPSDGSTFANVFISHYDPARALVRVDSLLPYRVTAAMSWPGFIETSRVWLPGYEATVDGKPAIVRSSVERMAMVPVPEGLHTVELRYVGTTGQWLAWWISALTWGGLLGVWAWPRKNQN